METNLYYNIAGITIKVDSDLPITPDTFDKKFLNFKVENPGTDIVYIHHHLGLPFTNINNLGKPFYFKPPWTIFKKDDSWIYILSAEKTVHDGWTDMAIFNNNYSRGDFYHKYSSTFYINNWRSLTFFPTDQILIARLLADRQGILLHSGAVILNGIGLIFIGHSGAGKSTIVKMLNAKAEILSDDRNIIRLHSGKFCLYGSWETSSWEHDDIPTLSSSSAPLKAILFLKKSDKNQLTLIKDVRDIRIRLLSCLIKPLLTADWWDNSIGVIEKIAYNVPCYEMEFDQSGAIVPELEKLAMEK